MKQNERKIIHDGDAEEEENDYGSGGDSNDYDDDNRILNI